MVRDAGDGIRQPSFWIYVVELGCLDEAEDAGGAVAALIGAREQPVLAATGDAAQRALGRVVIDLEATIVDVVGERRPARERVADADR